LDWQRIGIGKEHVVVVDVSSNDVNVDYRTADASRSKMEGMADFQSGTNYFIHLEATLSDVGYVEGGYPFLAWELDDTWIGGQAKMTVARYQCGRTGTTWRTLSREYYYDTTPPTTVHEDLSEGETNNIFSWTVHYVESGPSPPTEDLYGTHDISDTTEYGILTPADWYAYDDGGFEYRTVISESEIDGNAYICPLTESYVSQYSGAHFHDNLSQPFTTPLLVAFTQCTMSNGAALESLSWGTHLHNGCQAIPDSMIPHTNRAARLLSSDELDDFARKMQYRIQVTNSVAGIVYRATIAHVYTPTNAGATGVVIAVTNFLGKSPGGAFYLDPANGVTIEPPTNNGTIAPKIIAIRAITLGGSTNYAKGELGQVYVPSKWGGTLSLYGSDIKLFYDDGTPLTSDRAGKLIKGEYDGYQVAEGDPCTKAIAENAFKWFYFTTAAEGSTTVSNTFIEERCMPRMSDADTNNDVWCSWWWPASDDKNPNAYDLQVSYDDSVTVEPGPLRKYDSFVGHESPDSQSAWQWEMTNWWFAGLAGGYKGKCDAATLAGFEATRPSGAKPLVSASGSNIVFREQDQICLCVERYWLKMPRKEVDVEEPGTAYSLFKKVGDLLHADWFHNKLRDRITSDKGVILYDTEWNKGVYKYRAAYVADGTTDLQRRTVTIQNDMSYKNWDKWIGVEKTATSVYRLEYRNDGTIPSNGKAERAWDVDPLNKPKTVYYQNPTAPYWNTNLVKSTLESIYQ
jgi:hypothetical protein